MKTTFKKSVLAFLTCVLALAFALTGCSGGGKDPKANFVGSWQYSGGTDRKSTRLNSSHQ